MTPRDAPEGFAWRCENRSESIAVSSAIMINVVLNALGMTVL